MKNGISNLSCECINPKEVEVRVEVGLGQIMLIEDVQDIIKILEIEWCIVQILDVDMVTI